MPELILAESYIDMTLILVFLEQKLKFHQNTFKLVKFFAKVIKLNLLTEYRKFCFGV